MWIVPFHSTFSPTSSDDLQLPWLNRTFHFREEVITEILHRLPVKPLLRFRCVSKTWRSLIDSPIFVKNHLKKSIECNTDFALVVCGRNVQVCLANLDPQNNATSAIEIDDPIVCGAKFIGSCNGLVCLLKNETDVLLWNPSTRKCKKLPSAPAEFPRSFRMTESFLCGFGYDHQGDDYKVVKIAECHRKQLSCTMVVVYSLKSNLWRRIQDIPRHICFTGNCGVFASGALHWLAISNVVDFSPVIISFDLGAENYRELPIPIVDFINMTVRPPTSITVTLVAVGDRLCILDNFPGSDTDMWLMNGCGVENTWTRLCSMRRSRNVRPVAFSKSCEKYLFERNGKKLMWIDFEREKVEHVKINGIPPEFNCHAYTESLVQLTEDSKSDGMKVPKQSQRSNIRRRMGAASFAPREEVSSVRQSVDCDKRRIRFEVKKDGRYFVQKKNQMPMLVYLHAFWFM